MKRLVIFLLLVVPAMAVTFQGAEYIRGQIAPADYDKIICEEDKRFGAVSKYREEMCCVNTNGNKYCDNDEPMIGECDAGAKKLCLWHGDRDFWYSWRYRVPPCAGNELSILAAEIYTPILEQAQCRRVDAYWCCTDAFKPPTEVKVAKVEPYVSEGFPTGALLVLTGSKWRAMELGSFEYQRPEQRAFQFEQQRCRNGGEPVRIIDPKYGSFFKDINNLKPGMRAFYLTKERVIPLVSEC